MAKKAKASKTESVAAREARSKAEAAAAAAIEQAAREAAQAAEEAKAEAERKRAAKAAPRPKRPRFVRAEAVAKPEPAAVPLPPPSTKPAAKLLSKVVVPLPKDETVAGKNRGPKAAGDTR